MKDLLTRIRAARATRRSARVLASTLAEIHEDQATTADTPLTNEQRAAFLHSLAKRRAALSKDCE